MKKLSTDGLYLKRDDQKAFFIMADTAWLIFHKLKLEEIEFYLKTRASQGYNTIQAMTIPEYGYFKNKTVPNVYGKYPCMLNSEGKLDPTKPDGSEGYNFWSLVDDSVKMAAEYNIIFMLSLAWGDRINGCEGEDGVLFTDPKVAYGWARWVANRYKDHWNIIWLLGGDRPLEPDHRAIIDAMAEGILSVDDKHLITFHPGGEHKSTDYVTDAPYVDFHTMQSGHAAGVTYIVDEDIRDMISKGKPAMDSEPRYERHPACMSRKLNYTWQARDVRQNAYWAVLAGACGHTYGHNSVWSMTNESDGMPYTWKEAMFHEGGIQVPHVYKLRQSRDFYSYKPKPELLKTVYPGMGHMVAGTGKDYAFVYSPLGLPFIVDAGLLPAAALKASWFDPRTGEEELFAIVPGKGLQQFVPPSQGNGCDWVLILDVGIEKSYHWQRQ